MEIINILSHAFLIVLNCNCIIFDYERGLAFKTMEVLYKF